jgi:cyclic pyranopterin phosphate synthase
MKDDKPAGFRMIDVGRKAETQRVAVATGRLRMGRAAFEKLRDRALPKGDALALAEVAGITGAKRTADLIPLCHPLPLDAVDVWSTLDEAESAVTFYCRAAAYARTGVEMEALAGVTAALLTVHDLVKGTDPALTMEGIRLLVKTGGKSGVWLSPDGVPDWLMAELAPKKSLEGVTAAVITASDRASAGIYEDESGAILARSLEEAGARLIDVVVLPDERKVLSDHLRTLIAEDWGGERPRLVMITGGTGLGPRDVTPEVVNEVCERMVPGLGELLRDDGARHTPMAWLSRSTAGTLRGTLVIALPGSPKAVREGWAALLPILPHTLRMVAGRCDHSTDDAKPGKE